MKNLNSKSAKTTNKLKAKSDAATGLRELFVDELKDLYWAEKEITKSMPKMIKNATSEELIEALTSHLEETKVQITRLKDVFSAIGEKAVAKKCEAMAGLTKEGEEIMKGTKAGVVRDAGIISAGQKIEHYEIASYGTLASFARVLGEDKAASLLEETLNEEKNADKTLSQISDAINIEADDEDEEKTESKSASTSQKPTSGSQKKADDSKTDKKSTATKKTGKEEDGKSKSSSKKA